MTVTVKIQDNNQYGIDGKCDYVNCDDSSQHLYHGYSVESHHDIYIFIAEYCNKHTENHAEKTDEMFQIGSIN